MRRSAQSTFANVFLSRQRWLEAVFPWLLALLAVGYIAFHWSAPVTLAPDSGGYLRFSEHRTAGYPLFLSAVETLFRTTDAAAKVQLVIAATAFAFLGWSVHRAFRSPFFALAPVVALMLYPRIADLHGYILTESIFVSLLCLVVGAIALSAHRPTWQWMALAALACGLAIAVRPAGLSLLLIGPFLFWLVWKRCDGRRLALAAAVVAPIALCLVAESVIWHASHDSDSRPSLADRHLFAKALIIEPGPPLSDPELAGIIDTGREVMAPARELIAGAPSHYVRAILLAEFEVTGQHATYSRVFSPEVRAVADRRGIEEHRVVAQIGRPAMLSSPVAWIGNALTHYTGLWSRAFVTPATLKEFQSYIDEAERNELFETVSVFTQGVEHGSKPPFIVRFAMGVGLMTLPFAVALAVWQRLRQTCPDGRLVVAAVGAWAVHTHLLFVGLFGVMAGRYADSMAPFMAVSGALLALWAFDRLTIKGSKPTFHRS